MKKDDILIIRLVSVAVLLAALALIILFGVRFNVFTQLSDRITDGTITTADGGFPLYASLYYRGMGAIYNILFSLLIYSSVVSIAGIFLKIKGTHALAACASITGIVTGVFLVFSKCFENNSLLNRLFARIYLGESINYVKADNAVGAMPVRVVVFGILLIVIGCLARIMVKTSLIGRMKIYKASSGAAWLILLLPVAYGLYIDLVRSRVMEWAFSHNTISQQIYGIFDDYYLKNIFFTSLDKICVVLIAAVITLVLSNAGFKKKLIKHITAIAVGVLSAIGVIIFLANPPRLFGYITVDESVCDMVESVGIVAVLVILLDIIVTGLLTSLCLDTSNRISYKKILIIISCSMIISIAVIIAGISIPVMAVYISLLVINAASLIALGKFTYIR